MIRLNNNPDKDHQYVDVIDLSQLDAGDAFIQVDSGVTSGADSSSWDEILVDRDGRVDSCDTGGADNASALCKDTQPANNEHWKN